MQIKEKTYTSEIAHFFENKDTFKENWINHMLSKTKIDTRY